MQILRAIFFLIFPLFTSTAGSAQEIMRISPDLELVKITEHIYVHVSYSILPGYGRISANGMIFINEDRAFLFDTPWNDSLTCHLISYLREDLKLQIEGFIPNHWHDDCMGGLNYLKSQKIRTYANQKTIDIARSKGLTVPDQGFNDSLIINHGEKSICCYYPGAAHSMDNIVIWIPSEKVLFPGCMCKSSDSENLGNVTDGDIFEYPKTIDKVINKFKSLNIIVPGHGSIGGPELLTHTRSLTTQK